MTTDEIMKLADEYAINMWASVKCDPQKRVNLQNAVSQLKHDHDNHKCANTLMESAYDALQAKYDALLEKTKDGNFLGVFQNGELRA
jgi:hypothetical protein